MSVTEIEKAITELKPDEIAQLAHWFTEFQSELWDKQIESDCKSGALDQYIAQAANDHIAGNVRLL